DMNALQANNNDEMLRRDLLFLIHYYYDIPFDKLSIAEILDEVFRFMRNYRITLPSQLVILGKTMITLEGTARGLYEDFSVETIASSYLKYYRQEKLDLKRNLKNAKYNLDEYYYDLIRVPNQIKTILGILEKNNMKLDIGEFRSPKLEESIRKLMTLISMSITLAACIIGSSLILASSNIEKNATIRYVSISGFILSFIIGIVLIFMILKNNYKNR
ncbi:MAG: AarF/ABC1/UbiB kinase family protein, partial [Peptostreptococcus porci]|nr:AarF/ABC1/UbiB kinase family protein [Peptostreptococcus porci]